MSIINTYGKGPYNIVLLHGGPGAIGEMEPVAKHLSSKFGVLEPLQSKYSIKELIEELKDSIQKNSDTPVTLIGYSWGVWLAVIFASIYPELVKKVVLISSGSFEQKYVSTMNQTREKRMTRGDRKTLEQLSKEFQDPNTDKKETMMKMGELYNRLDSYSPIPHDLSSLILDLDMYNKIWPEASKMRETGELLEHLKQITCPIIAIHGDYDGHPAKGVKEPLEKHSKNSKFILLRNSGHTPWYERKAKSKFYDILEEVLED